MAAPLTIAGLSDSAAEISDIYAGKYGIDRNDDWFLLKLQEELGELAQAHLRLSGRGRGEATEQDRGDEAADERLVRRVHDVDRARAAAGAARGLREADLIPDVRDLPEFMAEPEFLRVAKPAFSNTRRRVAGAFSHDQHQQQQRPRHRRR